MPFRQSVPPRSRRPFSYVAVGLLAGACAALAAAPASAGDHNVTVVNSQFMPRNLTIQVGDSVTWTKAATTLPHNVRASDNSFRCANGCDGQGGSGAPITAPWTFTLTFDTLGEIDYFCEVHGSPAGFGMAGTITVQGGGGQPGTLRFSSANTSRSEGDGSAVITVFREGGDDGAVSVDYATGGGSATAGSDYTATSGTLDWGDNDDASKTFSVAIADDGADEPNETVGLTLSNPQGGAGLGSPSQATLTITDDDDPGPGPSAGNLRFTTGAQNVQEGAGSASVTVERVGGTAGAVSVQYGSSDGSAAAGSDYTAASGVLNWGAGQGGNRSFQVPILDDGNPEGSENLTVSLTGPTGGASVGSPGTQTITILDDDSIEPGPCVEDDHTLCLLGGRFRVRAEFTRPQTGVTEPANAIPFTDRAGMFWFFNIENIEMLFKMLNACNTQVPRFWVFYAATTNVAFRVTVDDIEALVQRVYENDQGTLAPPEADTGAFATCP